MAIRNTTLGGATNFSDGDILYAADMNDTFNAGLIFRKVHTDAGPDTSTNAAYTTLSSFTIAKPNGLLMGLRVSATLNNDTGGVVSYFRIKISGSTLGDYYITVGQLHDSLDPQKTWMPYLSTGGGGASDALFSTIGGVGAVSSASIDLNLKLLDATTTIAFQGKSATNQVSCSGLDITVVGVTGFQEL